MLRRALEVLSHGIKLKSRLPSRFGNFPIIVSPDARLGFWRRDIEKVDAALLAVAEEFVRPGDVVWDVGANVGVFSLAAAARSGPNGVVLAIEADTWLVDLIRQTCLLESSPRARIDVLPAAVDAELGIATFNIAKRGRAASFLEGVGHPIPSGGTRQQQRVMTISLDWLLEHAPPPNLVKIDVEGAEARVLRAAHLLLKRVRPTMICEVSSQNAIQVGELFASHGYTMFDMAYTGPKPRPAVSAACTNIIAVPDVPDP